MLTMQEYANRYNVYVAMDSNGSVWIYKEKPRKSLQHKVWVTIESDVTPITDKVQKPNCDWKDSLCTPHKETVAEAVSRTPKLYHTPCGDFMEGETIKAPVGERIFIAYASTLIEPYICLVNEGNNKERVAVSCWGKIEKLPTKKYEPFTEPNLEWIGTFIKGKKDGMVSRIVGFENDRGDWQVLCKNLEALNKTLCSESTESIPLESASFDGLFEYYTLLDGTPFGKEVTNE